MLKLLRVLDDTDVDVDELDELETVDRVLALVPVDEELPVVVDEVVAVRALLLVLDDTDVDDTEEVDEFNVVREEPEVVLAVLVLVLVPQRSATRRRRGRYRARARARTR